MSAPTEAEIERVINGYNRAEAAAGYAGSIVCEMQLVEGENYKMVWSTEYSGPFEPKK